MLMDIVTGFSTVFFCVSLLCRLFMYHFGILLNRTTKFRQIMNLQKYVPTRTHIIVSDQVELWQNCKLWPAIVELLSTYSLAWPMTKRPCHSSDMWSETSQPQNMMSSTDSSPSNQGPLLGQRDHVRKLLSRYSLPSAYEIMARPPSKLQWKKRVKCALGDFWTEKLCFDAAEQSSMCYLNLKACVVGSPTMHGHHAAANPSTRIVQQWKQSYWYGNISSPDHRQPLFSE